MVSGKVKIYTEVDKAKKGDRDKFTLKKDKKNIEIKIFTPSNNDKGYIQYTLWKGFKEEFKKHGNKSIDINDDRALIYAMALDLPMKDLNEFRTSVDHSYYPMGWGYLYFLTNKNGGSQLEDTFNNRFYGYNHSSSSNSTGTFGGGGGFTGGGGGGAGGGGGF